MGYKEREKRCEERLEGERKIGEEKKTDGREERKGLDIGRGLFLEQK